MSTVIVTSNRELVAALHKNSPEIIIDNPKLVRGIKRLKKLPVLVTISTVIAAGASFLLGRERASPDLLNIEVDSLTGTHIVMIIAIVSVLGVFLTIALIKDYDFIEFEMGELIKFKLVRKQKQSTS